LKRLLLVLAVALLTLSAQAFAAKNSARSPDATLAGKVRGALHATFGAGAAEISVTAQGGFVFLYGDVHSDSMRVKAERVAAGVPGVRAVSNELEVAPGA
jgi:osmotically-inducible protein OsmY